MFIEFERHGSRISVKKENVMEVFESPNSDKLCEIYVRITDRDYNIIKVTESYETIMNKLSLT